MYISNWETHSICNLLFYLPRLLFWIDKKSEFQYHLFKYPLNKSSKPTLIYKDFRAPKSLTIDPAQNRVYWLDDRDDGLKFYSSSFEGTNLTVRNMITFL